MHPFAFLVLIREIILITHEPPVAHLPPLGGCSLFLFLPSYKLGVQLSVTVWHVLCLVDICHLCCSVPSAVCRGRGVCVCGGAGGWKWSPWLRTAV